MNTMYVVLADYPLTGKTAYPFFSFLLFLACLNVVDSAFLVGYSVVDYDASCCHQLER